MGEAGLLGVIFDLDGVIVSTDDCHYLAWKRMADEEGIPFDRTVNERLRGVSRGDSLAIILEKAERVYPEAEKNDMAARKNEYCRARWTSFGFCKPMALKSPLVPPAGIRRCCLGK